MVTSELMASVMLALYLNDAKARDFVCWCAALGVLASHEWRVFPTSQSIDSSHVTTSRLDTSGSFGLLSVHRQLGLLHHADGHRHRASGKETEVSPGP